VRGGVALGLDQGASGEAWGYDLSAQRVIWTASHLPWPHYFVDTSGIGGSAEPDGATVVVAACGKLGPKPASQPTSPASAGGTSAGGTSAGGASASGAPGSASPSTHATRTHATGTGTGNPATSPSASGASGSPSASGPAQATPAPSSPSCLDPELVAIYR
jgi:hypothetical protein